MTSIRRISIVTISALLNALVAVAGASSALAQVPPDGGTGSGAGTTAPTINGGTTTLTYVLAAVAATAIVALVLVTARSLRGHTRHSHVVRDS